MFCLLATALATLSSPAHAESQLYAGGRFGAAFAPGYVRTAYSPGVVIGAKWHSGVQLGMRVVVLPLPPEVIGSDTPDLAVGPLVDFAYNFKGGERFELYPTVSLGVALGKSPENGTNQVLPQLQTGFGAHYLVSSSSSDTEFYVGPEFGVVPLVLAPYMAFTAGAMF